MFLVEIIIFSIFVKNCINNNILELSKNYCNIKLLEKSSGIVAHLTVYIKIAALHKMSGIV